MTSFFALTAGWLLCWAVILMRVGVEHVHLPSMTLLDSLETSR
jgi:hypothetical protein